jgi:hypothetical protein
MRNSWPSLIFVTLLFTCLSVSKELPLLLDKQGTFQILSRTDYTLPGCGFTKADMTENLKEITALVNAMRQNPVLAEMKGFEGRARIYSINCNDQGGYGVPSRISFEFASWYTLNNGTPKFIPVEPPEWSIVVNKQKPSTAWPFKADEFYGDRNIFMVPASKETIAPGIDRYDGEIYILYNSDRPPYWLPVTVNEAFNKLKANWTNAPDKIAAKEMLKVIETEYAAIPEADKEKPAHYGGVFVPNANVNSPPLLRANPDYWNRSLPKSAIQFLYLRMVNNKKFLRSQRDEALTNNSISYALYRFEETLNLDTVKSLLPIIRK